MVSVTSAEEQTASQKCLEFLAALKHFQWGRGCLSNRQATENNSMGEGKKHLENSICEHKYIAG